MSRVLVVGAGPAGLTAAIELARRGIEVHLAERRPRGFGHPRATVISTRVMELVRAWGLEDAVLAGGVEAEWLMWCCRTLAEAPAGEPLEIGYPTRALAAEVSPTAPACVPQDHLEAVLLAYLRTLPAATVERGAALVALDQSPDGVRAVLHDQSGALRAVEADHVIGADGAASTVRELAGIAMRGPTDVASGVNVVFRAPLDALVREHRYGIYAVEHPDGEGVLLPAGRGDRWMYGGMWEGDPDRDAIAARLRLATGVADLPVSVEHAGRFTFAGQLADRFRDRRLLLTGDAAHRVTPRGGTGMNTAIASAYDLAWKLAWVHRGWAPDALLDTYEADRRPYAEHNVARSLSPAGTRRTPAEELPYDLAGRLAHAWLGAGRSTLDLLGDGYALITGPEGTAWQPDPGRVPLVHHRVGPEAARALGLRHGGALLVRPDGVPVTPGDVRGATPGPPPMRGRRGRRESAEVLLYAPKKGGGVKLVGVEWFVVDADQNVDTRDADLPKPLGHAIDGPMLGHEPGMPIHNDLHLWLYEKNADGLFAPFNPKKLCG